MTPEALFTFGYEGLTLGGRTGAQSELLGLRGRKFEVKGQAGFSVEFLPDASGRYTQLALKRSGSSSLAQRVDKT